MEFLNSPLPKSILDHHPNDLVSAPDEWSDWWPWAAQESNWIKLLPDNGTVKHNESVTPSSGTGIPPSLIHFTHSIQTLQLPRSPVDISHVPIVRDDHDRDTAHKPSSRQRGGYGQSPKKHHEVQRMSSYVSHWVHITHATHIVDVGAGQGYLTRALANDNPGVQVLALDSNDDQTKGAERWGSRTKVKNITHRTIHITPETLLQSIDEWVQEPDSRIVWVALHACGSLTPDIIRAVDLTHKPSWTLTGAILVGCCYNLLNPTDFPLSSLNKAKGWGPLPLGQLQLAAQVPGTWRLSEKHEKSARVAVRKVAWRALVGRLIKHVDAQAFEDLNDEKVLGTGETLTHRRLGKINDKIYDDWDTFLDIASQRMKVDLKNISFEFEERRRLENQLSTLHVLRCLLGPLIESIILRDRLEWVNEELGKFVEGPRMEVELVNLFDQAAGSGRNVGIVIRPRVG